MAGAPAAGVASAHRRASFRETTAARSAGPTGLLPSAAMVLTPSGALGASATPRPYDLALFDFDGTLADTLPYLLTYMNRAADRFGFKRIGDHEVDTLRGLDPRAVMKHLDVPLWKVPMIARAMKASFGEDAHRIALFEGVSELLRRLGRHGVTLGIVSSNSAHNVRQVLGEELAGLIEYYECGAALFGKPSKLKKAIRRSGVEVSRAIYIGDEVRDADAAKAAKIDFGAVCWGYSHVGALRSRAPREVFGSVAELATWLGGVGDASPARRGDEAGSGSAVE